MRPRPAPASRAPRYVAFLRAINVGGRTVRMDALRAVFVEGGFSDVETFIASGNVIFRSAVAEAALGRQIETMLEKSLGYAVGAFVRSIDELHAIARHEPFEPDDRPAPKSTIYIILHARPLPPAARRELLALSTDDDQFAVKGREVYWRRWGSLLDSPFSGARLERAAGSATMRNRNTIVRLAARYPPEA